MIVFGVYKHTLMQLEHKVCHFEVFLSLFGSVVTVAIFMSSLHTEHKTFVNKRNFMYHITAIIDILCRKCFAACTPAVKVCTPNPCIHVSISISISNKGELSIRWMMCRNDN